jgi:hypothetical protein
VVIVVLGMFGGLGVVALVTRDRYDLRVRSGDHELELRPAEEPPKVKEAVPARH